MQRPQEIDKLIITQLKQFGCELIPDDMSLLDQFDKHLLYHASTVCVHLLFSLQQKTMDFELPNVLPPDMASCYRTCSKLANAIQALGYRDKIQFDQFLYPNESSTRKLLSWMAEQVSALKASDEEGDEANGASKQEAKSSMSLQERITSSLSALAKSTWTVPNPLSSGVVKSAYAVRQYHEKRRFQSIAINCDSSLNNNNKISDDERVYESMFKPLVSQQLFEKHQLAPSVFEDNTRHLLSAQLSEEEWNEHGIESGLNRNEFEQAKSQRIMSIVSRALASSKRSAQQNYSKNVMENVLNKIAQQNASLSLGHDGDDEDEEGAFSRRVQYEAETQDVSKKIAQEKENPELEEQRRIEEITTLQTYMDKVGKAMVNIKQDIERISNEIRQTEEELESEKQIKKKSEEKYNTVRTSVKLLADKENNMRELKRISDLSAAKLIELATEWESHRKPLIDQIRMIKSQDYQNKSSAKNQYEQYKKNRETMRQMVHDIKNKEEIIARLKKEYDELPKDIDRSIYVTRILDVVKNVEKQTQEINKILTLNRTLTNEIATTSDKLSRTFREVEELIYKDAQTNESSKKVYKSLLTMRETFEKIISSIQDAGVATNQIRDMEQDMERIKSRQDTANMERVANDLKMIKEENQKVLAELKK